jgi:hypothetical protein
MMNRGKGNKETYDMENYLFEYSVRIIKNEIELRSDLIIRCSVFENDIVVMGAPFGAPIFMPPVS